VMNNTFCCFSFFRSALFQRWG